MLNNNLHKFSKTQQAFSQHIRTTEPSELLSGIEDRRLSVYRELFFNNVEGFISSTFPVLHELLTQDKWQTLVRDFFVKHSCKTPYFLEISEEFLQYLETCELEFLPDFAYQLAHWEWMELYADVAETQDTSEILDNIQLNDCLTSNDCTWNLAYDYSVQNISSEYLPEETESTFLIVHRDADLSVGFIEINPLSMLLFETLKQNSQLSLKDMLQHIAQQQNMDVETISKGGLEIIRQWGALGLLKPFAP